MKFDSNLKWFVFFVMILALSGSDSPAAGKPVIENTVTIDDIILVLNGAGYRSAYGLRMYTGGLYLAKKSKNAQEIIDDNSPMAVLMEINSSLITGDRLEKSTREGFNYATNGNISAIKDEINSFTSAVKADLKKGDKFLFSYHPQKGTQVIKNGKTICTINGLQFKRALFGIWLCSRPPQKDLKSAMLGL